LFQQHVLPHCLEDEGVLRFAGGRFPFFDDLVAISL
jgi:hypothetical protein